MENIDINLLQLKKSVEVLRAISHKMRMNILNLLIDNGELHVQEIYNRLNLDQSIVSQQLRILKDVALVNNRRDGKQIYYTANLDNIRCVKEAVDKFDDISKERLKKRKESLRK
jgi:ArsR family transcriptional regulator